LILQGLGLIKISKTLESQDASYELVS